MIHWIVTFYLFVCGVFNNALFSFERIMNWKEFGRKQSWYLLGRTEEDQESKSCQPVSQKILTSYVMNTKQEC